MKKIIIALISACSIIPTTQIAMYSDSHTEKTRHWNKANLIQAINGTIGSNSSDVFAFFTRRDDYIYWSSKDKKEIITLLLLHAGITSEDAIKNECAEVEISVCSNKEQTKIRDRFTYLYGNAWLNRYPTPALDEPTITDTSHAATSSQHSII